MKKGVIILSGLALLSFVAGYFVGRFLTRNNAFREFSCYDIANFHADYLIRRYGIYDGFNTDQSNPRREINQQASNLNAQLLGICLTDPTR